MSTIVYLGLHKPDNKLKQEHEFRYYPDIEMKDKIITDLKAHSKLVMGDTDIVDIKIQVTIKQYDSKNT